MLFYVDVMSPCFHHCKGYSIDIIDPFQIEHGRSRDPDVKKERLIAILNGKTNFIFRKGGKAIILSLLLSKSKEPLYWRQDNTYNR